MVDDIYFSKLVARVDLLERQVAFLLNPANGAVGANVAYVDKPVGDAYPDVAEQKRKGNIIEAIKLYRLHTGVGLAEAKNYVENMRT